jgi:hypothetical protein
VYLLLELLEHVVGFGVLAPIVIFSLAGRWDLWNVWAYAGIVTGLLLFRTLGIYRISPDLLRERMRPPIRGRVRLPGGSSRSLGAHLAADHRWAGSAFSLVRCCPAGWSGVGLGDRRDRSGAGCLGDVGQSLLFFRYSHSSRSRAASDQ